MYYPMCLSLNFFLPCQIMADKYQKKQTVYINIILQLFLVGKEKDMTHDWLIAKYKNKRGKDKNVKKNETKK